MSRSRETATFCSTPWRGLLAALAIATGMVIACGDEEDFQCGDSGECGEGGRCESTGYCSFADVACGSGRRYGELAPTDLANRCVLGETAGTSSGGPDTDDDDDDDDDDGTTDTDDGNDDAVASTGVAPGCGNDQLDPGEDCDGEALGDRPTCGDHAAFPPDETVDCLGCEYRLNPCAAVCGDGTISDVWEQCDPAAEPDPLNGRTCADLMGFIGGALGCDETTCAYDTDGCIPA